MKICLYVHFFDLFPTKKTLVDRLNRLIDADPKHQMYETQSTDHILKSLKESGVDGLELLVPNLLTDKNILEIKKIIKKHQLPVFSIHQSNSSITNISLSEIQRLCEIANVFSAEVITLHSDTLGSSLFNKDFIIKLKKLQEKHKLRFGIENMPKSPASIFKTYSYDPKEFSSVVNNAGLFMTLDTTHLGQVNSDICSFYKENKEKIVDIHISDYKKSWLNRTLLLLNKTHLPLGKGELPITKFLNILKKENYQGIITMEINADLNGLCQNAAMIKKALG